MGLKQLFQMLQIHTPIFCQLDEVQFCLSLLIQKFSCFNNGTVLNGGGDYVLTPHVSDCCMHRQIIRLGSTTGEIYFTGLAIQCLGNGAS